MRFPFEARLKDGTVVELALAVESDVEPLRRLYRVIVEEGTSYPHHRMPDHEEFLDYWFRGKSTVVVYAKDKNRDAGMLGAFYLKPNWPGRSKHVANAGFAVAPAWREKGLGFLLGATMQHYAKSLGYRGVIFNLVFAENKAANHLWHKLGFRDVGVIPGAVQKDDGTFQDAIVMFRSLV